MKTNLRQIVTGALCALALSTVAMAPAHADPEPVLGARAGKIQNLQYKGDAATAQKIAAEFEGLIHVLLVDKAKQQMFWTIWTRDGQEALSAGEAVYDETDGMIYFNGKMQKGALQGLELVGRLRAVDQNTLAIDLAMEAGQTVLVFSQVLEQPATN